MQGKYTPNNYPITGNNNPINHDEDLANTFADHFTDILNSKFEPENSNDLLMNIQIHSETGNGLPYNKDLTLHELQQTIETINTNSAMGHDKIHNIMIKKFPTQLMKTIFTALNNLWKKGIFPETFKHSILIPMLKSNKDPTLITSYRPISLLSCLGKIYEKFIYNRLYWIMENKDHLPTLQYGFRKKRSCIDILINLEHKIQKTLRQKRVMLVCFFRKGI